MHLSPAYGRLGGLRQTAQRISSAECPQATPSCRRPPYRRDNETGLRAHGLACVGRPGLSRWPRNYACQGQCIEGSYQVAA
jgi:hypothetical protein